MKRNTLSRTGLLCVALILISIGVAKAEPVVIDLSIDAAKADITNEYVGASVGISGDVTFEYPGGRTETYDIPGRWSAYIISGDPKTSVDDNGNIIFVGDEWPCGVFGTFRVKIDDLAPRFVGDPETGGWQKIPITYEFPRVGMGEGNAGPYMESIWRIVESGEGASVDVSTKIRVSLVRDLVRFEITQTNNGNVAANVGFEIFGDVEVSEETSLIDIEYVPGQGRLYSALDTSRGYGQLWEPGEVPDYFRFFDDMSDPGVTTLNIVDKHDATRPDYLAIGEFLDLSPYGIWLPEDYNPDPLAPVYDFSWLLCWKQQSVPPKGSRTIVTYYGIGPASSEWTYKSGSRLVHDSAVLAVQTPRSVGFDYTPAGDDGFNPGNFDVDAYVYNLSTDPGPFVLRDVDVSIYLPEGLELVSPMNATQTIGSIPSATEATPITWTVKPTGEKAGALELYVIARDNETGWQQIVRRNVYVPAAKRSNFRPNWQLVSVPFTFNDPDITRIFSGVGSGNIFAQYYDAESNRYRELEQVSPGQAFWVNLPGITSGTQLLSLADDARIVGEQNQKQLLDYSIELKKGWNLVGNPFVYPVYWGQLLVYNESANLTVNMETAVENNWISKTIYKWNAEKNGYDSLKDTDTQLVPWVGHWVRAKRPITLYFRPPIYPEADVNESSPF